MFTIRLPLAVSFCLLFLPAWLVAADAPLRVMSFNIRYGTAKDGENHWDKRKAWVAETIHAYKPDLLGTQETLLFQRDYLAEKMPEYDSLAVGRNDGKLDGESVALFYRRDRFEKLDGGHFWLSETPDKPGSKGWDTSLPRMVTWVKLKDLQQPQSQPITFFNTHFDHMGKQARLESAKLLRKKIEAVAGDTAVVVTGDFNSAEASAPYQAFFGEAAGKASPVVDTFRKLHPERGNEEGTTTPFKASQVSGGRIDWIAVNPAWKITAAAIDRTSKDGRTPSDHWPVTAVLERGSATPQP
ncbi:endonuclease/exonuclease/phosphatase family protein [Anatilimnocola sp. NA78]|uniref:endonuclease/exonuclease/phosphatase family protein n=1 Tax=Anatilimnocola sp. NA78 TaxID=3415683 RepID=UPI003CE5078E